MTGPRRGAWGPRACAHLALWLARAKPVHLRPGDAPDTEPLDGIVITGGHDVEPTLYKAEPEANGIYDPERDAFELAAIDDALRRNRPILAICRGAQLLNVSLGGSLFQDLAKRRAKTSNRNTLLPLKQLLVEAGTRLAEVLGSRSIKINSLHRQGIDRVGQDLRVSGRDLDEIPQAVEHTGRDFVVGVQWHPEYLIYSKRQRSLFVELVRASKET